MNTFIFTNISTASNLHDLFTRHDDKHCNGFITWLDKSPIRQKKITFFSALFLNIVIIICLTVLAVFTIQSNLQAPHPPSMRLAFALTQNILLASAFVALLRSTILPFFLGECRLRFLHGFREIELGIRRMPRSRSLDLRNITIPTSVPKDSKSSHSAPVAMYHAVQKLVDPKLVYYKPGALLSSNYWTPEYPVLLGAYQCLGTGKFTEVDFDLAVWRHNGGTWTACELWRLQDMTNELAVSPASASET